MTSNGKGNKRLLNTGQPSIVKRLLKSGKEVIVMQKNKLIPQTSLINDQTSIRESITHTKALNFLNIDETTAAVESITDENDTQPSDRTLNDYQLNGYQSPNVSQSNQGNSQVGRESFERDRSQANSQDLTEYCAPAKGKAITIDTLVGNGINESDIKRLKDAGFHTAESIANITRRALGKIKGISEKKADLLVTAAMKIIPMQISTAAEYFNMRSEIIYITTGSIDVDRMLTGGIETGTITELFGEFASGKTQICHMLSVTCQLPYDLGGAEGMVYYIDTVDTFRPERLIDIANRYKLDVTECLKNITRYRVLNTDQLSTALIDANRFFVEQRYALVIVDCLTSLYRIEYCGRSELGPRQQHLANVLASLKRLACEFGVAIIVTNDVVANVDSTVFSSEKFKPIGGHVMAHATNLRLKLKKFKDNCRIVEIVNSPNLPQTSVKFTVNNDGIRDYVEC